MSKGEGFGNTPANVPAREAIGYMQSPD